MVVGRRAEQRWSLAGGLEVAPSAAAAPDLAASRLAHPSTDPPDAVVLVVDDLDDLLWLRAHTSRPARQRVPVVALVAHPDLVRAARAAGATAALVARTPVATLVDDLRAALAAAIAPADVIHLEAVRSA